MSRLRIRSWSGNRDAVLGLRDDVVDDVAQIVAALVRGELAIGARALLHDLPGVVAVLAGAELVDDVIDELEQLVEQRTERHLFALAEVDQLRVEAEARRTLFVLVEQRAAIEPPPHVLVVEL